MSRQVSMKWLALVVTLLLILAPATSALAAPTYSMEITFDGYTKASSLTDYPALVVLNEGLHNFQYNTFASPSGDDLRFYDSGGNELNYEIENWNTSGDSHIWVQVPTLSTGTTIEAHWGNTTNTQPAYTTDGSTWSSDYLGVYHLNSTAADSTANSNDGAYENGVTTPFTGQVAGGIDLSGGAHVDIGGSDGRWDGFDQNNGDLVTMSVWVNPDTVTADQTIFGRWNATGTQFLLWLDTGGIDNYVFFDDGGGPRTPEGSGILATTDEWQLVTATADGTRLRVYVDGVFSGQSGTGYTFSPSALNISLGTANGDSTDRPLNGSFDEARIAAALLSEDWIWADWASQSAPFEFATYGAAIIPEPSTLAMLLGLGAFGLLGYVRRRRRG